MKRMSSAEESVRKTAEFIKQKFAHTISRKWFCTKKKINYIAPRNYDVHTVPFAVSTASMNTLCTLCTNHQKLQLFKAVTLSNE